MSYMKQEFKKLHDQIQACHNCVDFRVGENMSMVKRRNDINIKLISVITFIILFFLNVFVSGQTLRIYHIDVEQGDATLFISPTGKSLLIDCGKTNHGSRIKNIMQQAGITGIDFFVNTHYHEDHFGGIDELLNNNVAINLAYDRGDKSFLPADKLAQDSYIEYESSIGNNATHLMRGETIPFDPEVAVTCIASGGTVLGEVNPTPGIDENDMSISLLFQYGSFRYFIGGDITNTTEGKIADRDIVTDVDVYHADHHGSHKSSLPAFMQDLKPNVIIISNGNNGIYQHPRQVTLDYYGSINPRPLVFQTNKYLKGSEGGNVADDFIGDLETTDEDGTILITINLSAGNYIISYRDKSHTIPIKGGISPAIGIVIESLLPNPIGNDNELEEITLRNTGTSSVSMSNWYLQDRDGKVWSLVIMGSINAGQSLTIRRNGMAMNLNNNGDEISLYDPSHQLIDKFQYSDSNEGIAIQTGH